MTWDPQIPVIPQTPLPGERTSTSVRKNKRFERNIDKMTSGSRNSKLFWRLTSQPVQRVPHLSKLTPNPHFIITNTALVYIVSFTADIICFIYYMFQKLINTVNTSFKKSSRKIIYNDKTIILQSLKKDTQVFVILISILFIICYDI